MKTNLPFDECQNISWILFAVGVFLALIDEDCVQSGVRLANNYEIIIE